MTVKLIDRGTAGELLLEGRLDSGTADGVNDVFCRMAERFDALILNLAGLDYVSSAGLRILRQLYLTMQKKGGELTLRHVNPYVMEVLEISGFVCMFKIEP